MRSRVSRVCGRGSARVLEVAGTALAGTALTGGTAQAAPHAQALAQATPLESLSTPVGLTAVVLGVVGMVAGVFRRKKTEVQPQNQRKT